ncbi:hypothetical protein [Streptomyces sp. NPDC057686]|uniref:hypothetical protein n=1 Tax=Streptomyces sp. NPDC057686 TaxID=3346212 RepID=UPI0036B865B6
MPSTTTEPSAVPAPALCTPAKDAAPASAPGSGRMLLHDPSGRRPVWNSARRSTSYGGSCAEWSHTGLVMATGWSSVVPLPSMQVAAMMTHSVYSVAMLSGAPATSKVASTVSNSDPEETA